MSVAVDFAATVGQVDPSGLAARIGVRVGDTVLEVNGVRPRDILEWRRLVDESEIELVIDRAGVVMEMTGTRLHGEPFGASVTSAVFDRVNTCDNHCEFCFIYQLPKGLRRSLYTKDDDYRLSFLFGNFTTLTRFTEADLERVVDEALSPLHVSIHRTDPHGRAEMLRNPRGGTSLRWLDELLDAGITVKGQIVLCPGVNDGAVLDETLADILESGDGIEEIAVVPLGLSRHNTEARMRVHDEAEASRVIDQIDWWRDRFTALVGRPVVHAADEFYVTSGRSIPETSYYGEYTMVEDGIGLVRSFIDEFTSGGERRGSGGGGFFAAVDAGGVPNPTVYRSHNPASVARNPAGDTGLRPSRTPIDARETAVRVAVGRRDAQRRVTVVTGECAAGMMVALVDEFADADVLIVKNDFFGGNTSVAGLMCGDDLARAIASHAADRTYLLPDVCLNEGRFLDDRNLDWLKQVVHPRVVEVLPARGHALRERLETARSTSGSVAP